MPEAPFSPGERVLVMALLAGITACVTRSHGGTLGLTDWAGAPLAPAARDLAAVAVQASGVLEALAQDDYLAACDVALTGVIAPTEGADAAFHLYAVSLDGEEVCRAGGNPWTIRPLRHRFVPLLHCGAYDAARIERLLAATRAATAAPQAVGLMVRPANPRRDAHGAPVAQLLAA